MSRQSRDYKYATRDVSPSQNLPHIRDVFGDVLEQPARTMSPENPDVYSSRRYPQRARPNSQNFYTESRLPPMQSRSTEYAGSRHSQTTATPRNGSYPQQSSSQNPHPRAQGREEDFKSSNYSYDVFVSTSSQGLVHQRSSHKDDFRQSAKEEAISTSTGKHACPECGRRFEKLSHYKNHMNSHSGEKPYGCPWPGCGKTFSASSNMRRHERSHGNVDNSGRDDVHDAGAMQNKWDSKSQVNSRNFYH